MQLLLLIASHNTVNAILPITRPSSASTLALDIIVEKTRTPILDIVSTGHIFIAKVANKAGCDVYNNS
jgi:hypothetical protein